MKFLQGKQKIFLALTLVAIIGLTYALDNSTPVYAAGGFDCENPAPYYTMPDGSIDDEAFFEVQAACNLRSENDPSVWSMLTGGFNAVLAFIFHLLNKYILLPVIAFEAMLIPWLMDPAHFQFASSPLVHAGWYMSLQIANLIIVLGMLLIANRIILGVEKAFDYKKLLDYVVAAIVVNFSLTIAGFIIGVSNALTVYFIGLSEGGANMTNRLMQITSVYTAMMLDTDNVAVGIFMLFLAVNMMVMLALIFGAILFTLLKRIIVLWIALIFLPIAYILGKFSVVKVKGVEDAWGTWQAQFMNAIMFPPLMGFFLWFTFLVMNRVRDLYTADNYDDQFWLQRLLQAAIFTGILLFGFQTANSAAGGAAGKIGEFVDKAAKGWGVDKLAPKQAKQIGTQWGAKALSRLDKGKLEEYAASDKKLASWYGKTMLNARQRMTTAAYKQKVEPIQKDIESLPKELLFEMFTSDSDPKRRTAAYQILSDKHSVWFSKQLAMDGAPDPQTGRVMVNRLGSFKPIADTYGIKVKPDETAYAGTYLSITGDEDLLPTDRTKRSKALITYLSRNKDGDPDGNDYVARTNLANLQRDIKDMVELAKTSEPEVADKAKAAILTLRKLNPLIAGTAAGDVVDTMNGEELMALASREVTVRDRDGNATQRIILEKIIEDGYLSSEGKVLSLMRAVRGRISQAELIEDPVEAERYHAMSQRVAMQIMEKGPDELAKKLRVDPICSAYYRAPSAPAAPTTPGETRTESGLYVAGNAPRRPEPPGGRLG